MSAADGFLTSAAGPYLAIAAMAAATYLCRVAGVVLMSYVRLTPRITRGLQALPGSIVVATTLPLAVEGGMAAVLGVAVAVMTMSLIRYELAALAAGLGTVALLRAFGF